MDAVAVQHRATALAAKADGMAQALRHMEEEFVNGRLSREMLAEKLQALSALQGRLRADVEGLDRWLVMPRGVAQQPSEPIFYAELLRSRGIPETEALGVEGVERVCEGTMFLFCAAVIAHGRATGWPAGGVAQRLQMLDDVLAGNARLLQQVRAEAERLLRVPPMDVSGAPPAVANSASLKALHAALNTGAGL